MDEEYSGVKYYLSIPAQVSHDPRLKAEAVLIYGEIAALANVYGKVFISNARLAERRNLTKGTVSRYVSQLEELGYITTELEYIPGTKQVKYRWITLAPLLAK